MGRWGSVLGLSAQKRTLRQGSGKMKTKQTTKQNPVWECVPRKDSNAGRIRQSRKRVVQSPEGAHASEVVWIVCWALKPLHRQPLPSRPWHLWLLWPWLNKLQQPEVSQSSKESHLQGIQNKKQTQVCGDVSVDKDRETETDRQTRMGQTYSGAGGIAYGGMPRLAAEGGNWRRWGSQHIWLSWPPGGRSLLPAVYLPTSGWKGGSKDQF